MQVGLPGRNVTLVSAPAHASSSEPPGQPTTRLGIVIVTRNLVATLLGTLARLTALPEAPAIVVVDNASTDDTIAAVRREFPAVAVIALTRNHGDVARNYGVRHLDRECIAFADDDSWWAPGSLARAAALCDRHPRLALLMSRVLVGPEERLDPACAAMARSPLPRPPGLPGAPLLDFVACGAIVRRAAFLDVGDVGGFHARFGTGGEEAWVAMNLTARGWHLAYIDTVVPHHHPSARRPNMRERYVEGISDRRWEAWARRSLGSALRITGRQLRLALTDPVSRAALRRALCSLPRLPPERAWRCSAWRRSVASPPPWRARWPPRRWTSQADSRSAGWRGCWRAARSWSATTRGRCTWRRRSAHRRWGSTGDRT